MSKGLNEKHTPLLWAGSLLLFIALLFARVARPDLVWLSIALGILLLLFLGIILFVNRQSIQREKAIRGAGSITTVILVICILGVINFLATRSPKKIDLTKNKVNTLSDQTIKTVKSSKEGLKFVLFSKPEQSDEFRPLFDNLKTVSSKVEVEYVNPVKESMRAQKAGLRSDAPTLQLTVGTREQLIETPNEEKITNALMKLSKTQAPVVCNIIGHGERDFESQEPNGYALAKTVLETQSYKVRSVELIKERGIPADCSGITILGPNKSLFPQEIKLISDYLDAGGKATFAIDFDAKSNGQDTAPEIVTLLTTWGISLEKSLIIDPVSKAFQLDATMPIVATYAKDQAITKEVQGNSIFAFARPIVILPKQDPDVTVKWIAQTTPGSWAEADVKGLLNGSAEIGTTDLRGPLNVGVAIDGRRARDGAPAATPSKDARIVVFGTSLVAANQYTKFGNNLDLFANAVSWTLEDENSISIRKNEAAGGTIELSERSAGVIFLVTVFLIPFLLIVCGIAIWWYRKKL